MNTGVFLTMLVTLLVVAAIMLALPAIMPKTVPLGVNVPAARVGEPVIRTSLRRYRLLIGVAWVLAVVVLTILVRVAPVAAALVSQLLFTAGTLVSYVVARQAIARAKHDGQWYTGVPVRIAGNVIADDVRTPVPVGWFAGALLLLAAATAVGISAYAALPARIPTHFGANGSADQYGPKTVWNAFSAIIIVGIVVLGLFALSFVNRVVPVRALASATAEENTARAHVIRSAMTSILGRIMFVITLGISWIQVVSWLAPKTTVLIPVGTIVMVVLLLATVVAFILRYRRALAGVGGRADAPDEDRYWKGGIFYVNRDDPAIVVQRRFGAGWTVNLGHPAGVAIGVVFVLVIAGVLIFALSGHGVR